MKKFVLSALLVHILTVATLACTCEEPPTPYQAYKLAQAVFIGKVVSSEKIPSEETARDPSYGVFYGYFKFAVTEVLKGKQTSQIIIDAGQTNSTCYQPFTVGESYLVYAYRSDQRFTRSESFFGLGTRKRDDVMFSGACTRTGEINHALDDVFYLRGLLQRKREPVLYGSVSRSDNHVNDPNSTRVTYLPGITVIAESNRKQFTTVTDENGLYSFSQLPNGEYKVRAVLPDKYTHYWPKEAEVSVRNNGYSAFAEFSVGWKNWIEGKVIDEAGNPVRRGVVRLLSADSPAEKLTPNFEGISDYLGNDGTYRIHGTTPGRYLLAVEVHAPFTNASILRTYYPQAKSAQNASVITLGEVDQLHLDLKLTSDLKVHWIKGVLVWSDGKPVTKNGSVLVEKLEDSEDKRNVRYDLVSVDEQGNFQLQVFENAQYWVTGDTNTFDVEFRGVRGGLRNRGIEELRSKRIKIDGSQITSPLKIVIELPEGATSPQP